MGGGNGSSVAVPEWTSGGNYNLGDKVTHNGKTYEAQQNIANSSTASPDVIGGLGGGGNGQTGGGNTGGGSSYVAGDVVPSLGELSGDGCRMPREIPLRVPWR